MERRSFVVGAAVLALLVSVGVGAATWGDEPTPAGSATGRAETHTVVVRTKLLGTRIYYEEGALVRVGLWPDGDPDWYDALRTAPMSVGDDITWLDVPSGEYELVGEVVPCNGNCGELGPEIDACSLPLEVDRDVEVVVRFRWGSLCEVLVQGS